MGVGTVEAATRQRHVCVRTESFQEQRRRARAKLARTLVAPRAWRHRSLSPNPMSTRDCTLVSLTSAMSRSGVVRQRLTSGWSRNQKTNKIHNLFCLFAKPPLTSTPLCHLSLFSSPTPPPPSHVPTPIVRTHAHARLTHDAPTGLPGASQPRELESFDWRGALIRWTRRGAIGTGEPMPCRRRRTRTAGQCWRPHQVRRVSRPLSSYLGRKRGRAGSLRPASGLALRPSARSHC